jgi:hypothetical protein
MANEDVRHLWNHSQKKFGQLNKCIIMNIRDGPGFSEWGGFAIP